MVFTNEGRLSDSPFIDSIWRGRAEADFFSNCPAEGRWHLLVLRAKGRVNVSVAGPMTRAKREFQMEGAEWLVVKFRLGVYMPHLSARDLVDTRAILPGTSRNAFYLNGAIRQ